MKCPIFYVKKMVDILLVLSFVIYVLAHFRLRKISIDERIGDIHYSVNRPQGDSLSTRDQQEPIIFLLIILKKIYSRKGSVNKNIEITYVSTRAIDVQIYLF